MTELMIRKATPADAAEAVTYLKKLGAFMGVEAGTTVTAEKLSNLLESEAGRGIFGMYGGETVAFMYYFYNSASLRGEKGIYIDSLYIDEAYRRGGIGKEMIRYVAKEALQQGCTRLEWLCFDWNTKAIDLYDKIGAAKFEGVSTYRMPVDRIRELAGGEEGEREPAI